MKPKIYFDINGVMEYQGSLAIGIKEYVSFLVANKYEVFWLTTHCNGDSETAVNYILTLTDDNVFIDLLKTFKPTKWDFIKPEGIDFLKDFIWYEDKSLTDTEEEYLRQNNGFGGYMKVNLFLYPDYWKQELERLKMI